MARKAKLVNYLKSLEKSKYKTRVKSRCRLCGRSRGYMRDFDMCRICFRSTARDNLIPGIKKSSW